MTCSLQVDEFIRVYDVASADIRQRRSYTARATQHNSRIESQAQAGKTPLSTTSAFRSACHHVSLPLKNCFALFHESPRAFFCVGGASCDPLPFGFGQQLFGV
jgi:hypothetical protein